jgi:hypothetical protein
LIVSIGQPAYLPWLGYFDRIAKSDLHVVLDHVDPGKRSMVPRNKVRTAQDWTWITVPLLTKGRVDALSIASLAINNDQPWARKHWNTLQANYSKAPYFSDYKGFFQDIYDRDWTRLTPLLDETTTYLLDELGIGTRLVRSSNLDPSERKSELILDLCRKVGATTYISGPFGRDYLDLPAFECAGIKVVFHDYAHPEYRQAFDGFEPYMSIIDLLFNHGPGARRILESPPDSLVPALGPET